MLGSSHSWQTTWSSVKTGKFLHLFQLYCNSFSSSWYLLLVTGLNAVNYFQHHPRLFLGLVDLYHREYARLLHDYLHCYFWCLCWSCLICDCSRWVRLNHSIRFLHSPSGEHLPVLAMYQLAPYRTILSQMPLDWSWKSVWLSMGNSLLGQYL